jgi:secreted PhoX family phosphatase
VINVGTGKLNPSVQRINLSTGVVETILRGMDRCDGIRTTAWGTILATEETSDGGAYEILNPLTTTEITVTDRATGTVTDSTLVAKRTALMLIAWEGIAVLPDGVIIAGDELRPGTGTPDLDGGAIFKFIPAAPHPGGLITDLANSPLTAGTTFALRVSCTTGTQYGQGCEIGRGEWVSVAAANARADADANGATGYYRPEDLHQDPIFSDETSPNALRFCWTNTGNSDASNYAEVMCAVDENPSLTTSITTVSRFVEGDTDFNSFDNLDFQPGSGILYVVEDHENGDIFACLRDGLDRDIKTDGCIRILCVKDSSAEPTGFIFSADGKTAYVNIQHSDDTNMTLVDDYATDDLIIITGFN